MENRTIYSHLKYFSWNQFDDLWKSVLTLELPNISLDISRLETRSANRSKYSSLISITVWKSTKFSRQKIIREINSLLTTTLLSQDSYQKSVGENFCNFHTISIYNLTEKRLKMFYVRKFLNITLPGYDQYLRFEIYQYVR